MTGCGAPVPAAMEYALIVIVWTLAIALPIGVIIGLRKEWLAK